MSKTLPMLALILAAGVTVTSDAAAEWNVERFEGRANRIYTTVGLDPAIIPSVGYGRVMPVFGHPLELTGELGIVAADLDAADFRARFRALSSLVHWRSIHLTGAAMFIMRGTENSVYRGFNFGARLHGTAGCLSPWVVRGRRAQLRQSHRHARDA